MAPSPKPSALTGGCLCKSVRYTITIPEDSQWPPKVVACHCVQCRKQTGTFTTHFLSVRPSQVHWDARSTFTEFNSSPGCYRGFCTNCGGSLTFRMEKMPNDYNLLPGTLDDKWLLGEGESKAERTGGYGVELGTPRGGIMFCKDAIVGVTDGLRGGPRWWGMFDRQLED